MYTSVSVHQFVYDDGQKSQILMISRMAMKTDKSVRYDQSNRLSNPLRCRRHYQSCLPSFLLFLLAFLNDKLFIINCENLEYACNYDLRLWYGA